MESLKLLVVGDKGVGKSCLYVTYDKGEFPSGCVPSAFHKNVDIHNIVMDRKTIQLHLLDTFFGDEILGLTTITYRGTDIFFVCFSVANRESFLNVERKWIPKVQESCQKALLVIVACKIDMRSDRESEDTVTYEEGSAMARRLGVSYQETSALTMEGLGKCFNESIYSLLAFRNNEKQILERKKRRLYHKKSNKRIVLPAQEQAPVARQSTFATDISDAISFANLEYLKAVLKHIPEFSYSENYNFLWQNEIKDRLFRIINMYMYPSKQPEGSSVEGSVCQADFALCKKIRQKTVTEMFDLMCSELQTFKKEVNSSKASSVTERLIENARNMHLAEKEMSRYWIHSPSKSRQSNIPHPKKETIVGKPGIADVIFKFEDGDIFAHKVILCARCKVMATMFGSSFKEGTSVISEVIMKDTTKNSFLAFLEYLYTDRVHLELVDPISVLALANRYDHNRLLSLCEEFIAKELEKTNYLDYTLGKRNIINVLLEAQKHNADQLSKWCRYIISHNYVAFENYPELFQLHGDNQRYVQNHRLAMSMVKPRKRKLYKRFIERAQNCIVM